MNRRIAPLPDTNRLLTVWNGAQKSTTSLEHATHVFVTMRTIYLTDVDPTTIGEWQHYEIPKAATDLSRTIARVIDDEISWHIGNRHDTAVLIDDDSPELVTAGELVGRIAMFTVLFDKWPPHLGQCPLGPAFLESGRQFDKLMRGLAKGRRQPRRRCDGLPPIPRPQRIELGAVPRSSQP